MIDFGKVMDVTIPEGEVEEISRNGTVVWRRPSILYVSLGDSIAAGHTINDSWASRYGEGSQYGVGGNTETAIVADSYTDLIRIGAESRYGADYTRAVSFARSGDTTADLIGKLDHDGVREALSKANLVTVCIGANDVLQPALMDLEKYIETGDLSNAEVVIEENLARLANDSDANSYKALLDKLNGINPNARYVFTTIYNPYKYLWIDEGQYGFFGPLLSTIPDMNMSFFGITLDIDGAIKDGLLSTPAVQTLFDRVNGLCDWAEQRVGRLNEVIRAKVAAAGSNFAIAEAKAAFDQVPDRPVSAPYHYNDLVSVEYTRGYDTMQMDWGALWRAEYGDNAAQYWLNLATGYASLSGFDINGFAADLVGQMIEKVIVPDIDPHPEPYGHLVLSRAFGETIGE